jgi:amino acid adenylation domain-containing protein/thioester reductase-like protein
MCKYKLNFLATARYSFPGVFEAKIKKKVFQLAIHSFALTQSQDRTLARSDTACNVCAVFQIDGHPDANRLTEAINQVAIHCDPLAYRTVDLEDGTHYIVQSDTRFEFQIIDIGEHSQSTELTLIEGLCARSFRMDMGLPWSFTLLLGAHQSFLVFACHPALLDRFSLKSLFDALSDAYGGKALAPALGLDQRALLEAEQSLLTSERLVANLDFWIGQIGESSFEWHAPRNEQGSAENCFTSCLDVAESRTFYALARSLGMAPDVLLVLCVHVVLQRLTSNSTVLTAYNQRGSGQEQIGIGFDERRRILRTEFDDSMTLREFIHRAAARLDMNDFHSDLPAFEVLDEMEGRIPGFVSCTNVLCEPDTLPYDALRLDTLKATLLAPFSRRASHDDIAIYLDVREQVALHVQLRNPQELDGVRVAFEHCIALLTRIETTLDRQIGAIDLYTPALDARRQAWSDGGPVAVPATDVLDLFAQAVQQHGQSPAVSGPDAAFSYGELSDAAQRVAAALIVEAPDTLIGICMSRGALIVPAIFGVLARGAGYLPLDPQMPDERLRFIADDAQLAGVIVDAATYDRVAAAVDCPVYLLGDLLGGAPGRAPLTQLPPDPARTAYVIYTSGTTGKPKGVVIERGMLAHFVASLSGLYERSAGTRWLQFASVNFDASVLEIFNPLTHGGHLVIAPEAVRTDAEALFAFLKTQRISHAFLPPAILKLMPRRPLPDLTTILCGGEASDNDTIRFWSKMLRLSNIYGPTETTVMATENTFGWYKLANNLGRPLPGFQIHLLDDRGQPAPLCGVGEICIGGMSVARGYLRRPDLNKQKFGPNPFGIGRLYRSGDLGRFLPNGELEFLGRRDFQVKIRGYRIEVGEIESVVAAQPEVRGVYVGTCQRQGGVALVAWYVSDSLDPAELRGRLENALAHYMVPSFLIPVAALPLNLNGKIDRSRLPEPQAVAQEESERELDQFERAMRAIWADTLGVPVDSIGASSHFFQLGGHSLLATLVCNRVSSTLNTPMKLKALFEHPVFSAFCAQARAGHPLKTTLPALVAASDGGAPVPVPVANRLVRMMHNCSVAKLDDNTYQIVVRVAFTRETHPLRLHQALTGALGCDPLFRACLVERDTDLMLQPGPEAEPAIRIESNDAQAIDARIDALRGGSLPLADSPLWRAELLLCPEEGTSTLLFCIHHAIFDGWSLQLLLNEVARRYEGRTIAPRPLSWFDYCRWEPQLRTSPLFTEARDYWSRKLAPATLRTELPFDSTRRADNANRSLTLHFGPAQAARFKRIAELHGMTLPPVLFALYLVWIWRISGQAQLACAYPNAGRGVAGSEDIYGMFVSMAVLVQGIEPRQTFSELARAVQNQMLDDQDHLLATPYDTDNAQLGSLNTIFSLQNGIDLEGRIGDASYRAEELPSLTSKVDLSAIFYARKDGGLDGRIEYDSSLLHTGSIEQMAEVFHTLFEAAGQRPGAQVGELNYLSERQRTQCLAFACGDPLPGAPMSIPARFETIAATFPMLAAVRFGDESLNYRELELLSDRIALGLAETVESGARVGLSMRKGSLLVATVLGVLKAGCAYVPLDPDYPPERLRYFVSNCAIETVLTDASSRLALEAAGLTGLRQIDPAELARRALGDRAPLAPVASNALAYVIHTSGSTGKPKGVLVEHHSVVRMVEGASLALDYVPGSVSTLAASTNFDASVLDIFLPLLHGGTLVVLTDEARRDPATLHRLLKSARVTHASLAPVVVQSLPREALPDLQLLGFGGDSIDESTAKWWAAHTRLFSLYGPTETTVMASCGQVMPGGPSRIIGKPLPGYRLYLLNAQRQPVPPGTVGEIYIGGQNLARGYVNQPAMTMERFVVDPFNHMPYALMYRTGDLGRFLPDGTIEYLGRNDAQIKLRGFRIELGEIESCIAAAAGVAHAACAVWGEGEQRYIAAYYVAEKDAVLDEDVLRQHVANALPEYMVPAWFKQLDAIPASASGKVDRKALPAMLLSASNSPPHDGAERQLADIWERLLQLHHIGRDDNFFRLGGNSILAVRMQAEARQTLGIEFAMSAFYRSPTIATLVAGQQENMIQLAIADAATPLSIDNPAPPCSVPLPVRTMLLTGATGFLGIYLLDELVRQVDKVICLQRCDRAAAGEEALRRKAREAGLAIDFSRVEVISSDLASPGLGLDSVQWHRLAEEVDAILHCGAFVHHLHGYAEMKQANVGGTENLLRLALTQRQKPLCFISTMSVPAMQEGATSIEERVKNAHPQMDNGYLLTKWVGEQRVAECARRFGLPAIVARPGNITGDSQSGYSNYAHNHFWLYNRGCIELGAFPDIDQEVEMMPVDQLARAVVALTLHHRDGLRVANLSNPVTLSQRRWFNALAKAGLRVVPEAPLEWQQRLTGLPASNGLALIRDFYTGDLSGKPLPIEQIGTITELAKRDVQLTVDYERLIPLYLAYLRAEGFVDEPVADSVIVL